MGKFSPTPRSSSPHLHTASITAPALFPVNQQGISAGDKDCFINLTGPEVGGHSR